MASSKTVNIVIKAFDQTKAGLTMPIKNLEDLGKAVDKLKPAMAALGATAAAAFAGFAVNAVGAAESMRKMATAMSVATGDSKLAADELGYVRDVANELGIDLQTSASAFTKLAASAAGTSLAGQGVRDVFRGVSEASTALGLSAEQTNGALIAIGQIMSKGKVQAEELRGQLGERIPGAFQIAARAMNMTTAELSKQLELGNVMSDEFLPKFATELSNTFGGAAQAGAESLTANIARLKNSFFELSVLFGEAFLPSINSALRGLLNFERETGTMVAVVTTAVQIVKGFAGAAATLYTGLKILAQVVAVPLAGAMIIFEGTITALINQFAVLGRNIDSIMQAFMALGNTARDIGEVISRALDFDRAGANVALDKAVKNWDARIKSLGDSIKNLGSDSFNQASKDFSQTFDALSASFENASGNIKAEAFDLFTFLDNLYSKPTAPAPFSITRPSTTTADPNAPGKFTATKGRDEEEDAINKRIKDLEKFREIQAKTEQELIISSKKGADQQIAISFQVFENRMKDLQNLSLTDSEIAEERIQQQQLLEDEITRLHQEGVLARAEIDQQYREGNILGLLAFHENQLAADNALLEAKRGFLETLHEMWTNSFYAPTEAVTLNFLNNTVSALSDGLGNAMTNLITGAMSAKEAFSALGKEMIGTVVSYFSKLIANTIIYSITSAAIGAAAAAAALAQATALTVAWTAAATAAAIATFGGATAAGASVPIMMASNVAFAKGLSFAGIGQAHQGMDYVSQNGSYNLREGEMIVDPGTSEGLREFADDYEQGKGGMQTPAIINFVLDGRSLGQVILDMSKSGELEIDGRAIRTA